MELIKAGTNFDFVGKMKIAFGISLALIAISIASIVWHGGLNYGIDFPGDHHPDQVPARAARRRSGLPSSPSAWKGDHPAVRRERVVVRIGDSAETTKEKAIRSAGPDAALGRGPSTSAASSTWNQGRENLTKKALLAIFFSWVGMLISSPSGSSSVTACAASWPWCTTRSSPWERCRSWTRSSTSPSWRPCLRSSVIHQRHHRRLRPDPGNVRRTSAGPGHLINTSVNETLSRTILTALTVFIVLGRSSSWEER